MIRQLISAMRIAVIPFFLLILLRVVEGVVAVDHLPGLRFAAIGLVKLAVSVVLSTGLYALLFEAVSGRRPVLRLFTEGVRRYLAPYFWVTTIMGGTFTVVWTVVVRGWVLMVSAPPGLFPGDPYWTTMLFALVSGVTMACFLYAMPYVFLEEGRALIPIGRAFRFLAMHPRASCGPVLFALGYVVLGYGTQFMLIQQGVGGVITNLVLDFIHAIGAAITFMAGVSILRWHRVSPQG